MLQGRGHDAHEATEGVAERGNRQLKHHQAPLLYRLPRSTFQLLDCKFSTC